MQCHFSFNFWKIITIYSSLHSYSFSEPEITESTETENADLEPEEPLPALSTAELFAQRQQKIMGRKMKMAGLACHIIENPEEHVSISGWV